MNETLLNYKQYLLGIKRSLVYFNYIKILFDYLEKNNLTFETLTKDMLTTFFNEKNYSTSARNNFLKAGRDFGKYINQENIIFREIKLLPSDKKISDYITEEDIDKAIKYLATYHTRYISSNKANALLKFMFYTGVRKGEIISLKRENFDLENCSVKIWGEKTKKDRIVYYPVKVKNIVIKYFNYEKEEINAFNIKMGQISYLPILLQKYFPDKHLYCHLFRHGNAKFLDNKGVSVNIISKLLGHTNIQTTMIYLSPDQKMIENAYKDKIK